MKFVRVCVCLGAAVSLAVVVLVCCVKRNNG